MELSLADLDMIDTILNTTTYNKLFDELVEVGMGKMTDDTASNVKLFHHHRLQYMDMTSYDKGQVKRDVFLNIATQVISIDT